MSTYALPIILAVDVPALLVLLAASVSAAIIGNFLVLQRQSLLGDALAHAVLPGIVIGFMVTGMRTAAPLLGGALLSAIAVTLLVEFIRRRTRLDGQGILGVVFTSSFALGILLIAQQGAKAIHLDAETILYGQLENVLWPQVASLADFLKAETWLSVPREVVQLWILLAVVLLAVRVFYKELQILSFDALYGRVQGMNMGAVRLGFMLLVALVTILSFEAVGSILIVALLVTPAAAARLLADRLPAQISLSVVFALVASVVGYPLAAWLPPMLGAPAALNAGAMVAVVAGLILACSVFASLRKNSGKK